MYQYFQSSGELLHNWQPFSHGYSGLGEAKNCPDKQNIEGLGPIPCGTWRIGKPYHHPKLGPVTMDLEPIEGTETFGRSEFRIHGDSVEHPGSASHGCIVTGRVARDAIAAGLEHDDLLRVIARPPDEVQSVRMPNPSNLPPA